MDSYSATDLEHSWEAAEATFLRLKGLKVEALSIWLQETKDKVTIICELRKNLLSYLNSYRISYHSLNNGHFVDSILGPLPIVSPYTILCNPQKSVSTMNKLIILLRAEFPH